MYHCKICSALSPPGQPRLLHVIERLVPRVLFGRWTPDGHVDGMRREVADEWPVCAKCKAELDAGFALATLLELHAPQRPQPAPAPVQPPPAPMPLASDPAPPPAQRIVFGKR